MMLGKFLSVAIVVLTMVLSGYRVLAAILTSWKFDPQTNQLEFTLAEKTTPRYFILTEPPRIVVDLPNTNLGQVPTQQNFTGLVRQIRVSQFEQEVTRLVLELSPEIVLSSEQVQLQELQTINNQNRWRLTPLVTRNHPNSRSVSMTELPPATFPPANSEITVRVPPLTPGKPVVNSADRSQESPSIIDFGQPLPRKFTPKLN